VHKSYLFIKLIRFERKKCHSVISDFIRFYLNEKALIRECLKILKNPVIVQIHQIKIL